MMDFSTLVANDTTTTATVFTVNNLKYKTVYYWRVAAVNAGGTGAWSQVWSFTTEESTSIDEPLTGAAPMSLYPNPTQQSAVIGFTTPDNASMSLVITNAVGMPVWNMTESQLAAGEHTVTWNTSDIASGTYFVRLTVNGLSQLSTLTVIK